MNLNELDKINEIIEEGNITQYEYIVYSTFCDCIIYLNQEIEKLRKELSESKQMTQNTTNNFEQKIK